MYLLESKNGIKVESSQLNSLVTMALALYKNGDRCYICSTITGEIILDLTDVMYIADGLTFNDCTQFAEEKPEERTYYTVDDLAEHAGSIALLEAYIKRELKCTTNIAGEIVWHVMDAFDSQLHEIYGDKNEEELEE